MIRGKNKKGFTFLILWTYTLLNYIPFKGQYVSSALYGVEPRNKSQDGQMQEVKGVEHTEYCQRVHWKGWDDLFNG